MDDKELQHELLLKAMIRESAEIQERLLGLATETERLNKRAAELSEVIRRNGKHEPGMPRPPTVPE